MGYLMNYSSWNAYVIYLPSSLQALREFSEAHLKLTKAGVKVVLFCNERWYGTPDAVFPNNWFSTHSVQESDDGSM